MSFWAQRVGLVPPQQPQAAPQQPASTRPWWQAQPVQTAPQIVPQQPYQQPQTAPQPGSVAPNGEVPFGDLLQQSEYTTEKAQSAKQHDLCPECDSVNYMSPKGMPNAMKQCFDCGFNPRFAHSTAGLTSTGMAPGTVSAPQPARVQKMNSSTFDARHIVGRVTTR